MLSSFYKRLVIITFIVTMLVTIAGCSGGPNAKLTPPQDLVGTWLGSGQHSLNEEYLGQKDISFELTFNSDGALTGRIGDASIVRTYITKSPFYMKILGKEKYRAEFEFDGKIVNNENFSRLGGTIIIRNISSTEIVCSFNSSGSKVKSDNLILPIKEIVLTRRTATPQE
jgi:hypothetical protein